jgi:hypothetical protein
MDAPQKAETKRRLDPRAEAALVLHRVEMERADADDAVGGSSRGTRGPTRATARSSSSW